VPPQRRPFLVPRNGLKFGEASTQAAQRGLSIHLPLSHRVPKISHDWETSLEDISSSETRAISQRGPVFAANARRWVAGILFFGLSLMRRFLPVSSLYLEYLPEFPREVVDIGCLCCLILRQLSAKDLW
jgi:hypothetical protein